MAGEVATAWVTLAPSFKGGQSAISKEMTPAATAAGKTAGGKFAGGFGGAIKSIGGLMAGALVVSKVTDFFGSAISGASDLNETVSKSRVIFGGQAADIEKWSSSAAETMGLSKQAALDAATGFGDMFSQIGFAGDEAAKMSQGVVQLSADLGSFNNLPTEDVSQRISAAFRGEYDSLQALIPNINAARVEKEALAATGKKEASALTAAEKASAVLAIVQKDGAKAAGDFARTSDGLANSQKILTAKTADLKAGIGESLLPVMQKLTEIGAKVIDFIVENGNVIGPLVAVLGILAGVIAVVAVAQWAWAAAVAFTMWPLVAIIAGIALLVAAFLWLWNNVDGFAEFWMQRWEAIKIMFTTVWEAIQAAFKAVMDFILVTVPEIFNKIVSWVTELPGRVASAGAAIWDWMLEKATAIWDSVVGVWNGAVSWISGLPGKIKAAGAAIFDWVLEKAKSVWTSTQAVLNGIVTWASGLPGKLASAAGDVFGWILDEAREIVGKVGSIFADIGGTVLDAINPFKSAPPGGGAGTAPAAGPTAGLTAGPSSFAPATTGAGSGRVGRWATSSHLAAQQTTGGATGTDGLHDVRIFVGDREIKDIVRVEVDGQNRKIARRVGVLV